MEAETGRKKEHQIHIHMIGLEHNGLLLTTAIL
jgi:hypothetical protein